MSLENVTNKFKKFIYHSVELSIENKMVYSGKLTFFQGKHYFVKLTIERGDKVRKLDIPYPYEIEEVEDGMVFNYCLSAICPVGEVDHYRMLLCANKPTTRFHGKHLKISIKKQTDTDNSLT